MNLSSSMFRPIAGRRRAICGLLGTLAFATLASGCSPEFNWRETRSEEHRFMVLLPARPATMSREIDLEGRRVQMTMTGARVDQAMFTVGAIQLEAPDAELGGERARALAAMRVAMLRNIGAEPRSGDSVRVGRVDGAGASRGAVDGFLLQASGRVAGNAVVMQAIFVGERDRLWQAVAITPPAQAEQARTMLDSFRVMLP
jgi:hypothetical protein